MKQVLFWCVEVIRQIFACVKKRFFAIAADDHWDSSPLLWNPPLLEFLFVKSRLLADSIQGVQREVLLNQRNTMPNAPRCLSVVQLPCAPHP